MIFVANHSWYCWLKLFSSLMIRHTFTISEQDNSCEYTADFAFGSSYVFTIPSNFVFGTNVSFTHDFKYFLSHIFLLGCRGYIINTHTRARYILVLCSMELHLLLKTIEKAIHNKLLLTTVIFKDLDHKTVWTGLESLSWFIVFFRQYDRLCPKLNCYNPFCLFLSVSRNHNSSRIHQAQLGPPCSADPTVFLHHSWWSDVFCYWSGVFLLTGKEKHNNQKDILSRSA